MPKLKTRKSVASRVKKTKTKKFLRRSAGQSHFNARDTGKTGRNKRKDFGIAKPEHKALNSAMPHA